MEKTIILVRIYNQQFQGTIFFMVGDFRGNHMRLKTCERAIEKFVCDTPMVSIMRWLCLKWFAPNLLTACIQGSCGLIPCEEQIIHSASVLATVGCLCFCRSNCAPTTLRSPTNLFRITPMIGNWCQTLQCHHRAYPDRNAPFHHPRRYRQFQHRTNEPGATNRNLVFSHRVRQGVCCIHG